MHLTLTTAQGTVPHWRYRVNGRTYMLPARNLQPTPSGARMRTMGKRPPLRALRAKQPQVQACKLPRASAPCNPATGYCASTARVQPCPTCGG